MTTLVDDFKVCDKCKEKIHKDAVICIHCKSYQNWRRHLGLSSTFLSLLLALISVSTVFVTVLSSATVKNDSDINASIINWQRTYFNDRGKLTQVLIAEFFVTNSGKKPGALKSLSIKGADEEKFEYLRSGELESTSKYSHKEIKTQIIEPGKTLLLKRYLKIDMDVKAFENKYSNAALMLEVINFSGEQQKITLEVINKPPVFFE